MSFSRAAAVRSTLKAASCVLLSLTSLCCAAQDSPTNAPLVTGHPAYTLHVYTNLIQVPTLILSPYLDYAPKVDAQKLLVKIDDGKPFHPVRTRIEGDDPISLAILIDLSNDQSDIPYSLVDGITRFAKRSLRPHDEVAVYALDCRLMRTLDFTAPDPGKLKIAVTSALATAVRDKKHRRPCGDSIHLRDSLLFTAGQLSQRSGRRVLLALTHGEEYGSKSKFDEVRDYFVEDGVTIFALYPSRGPDFAYGIGHGWSLTTETPAASVVQGLQNISETTGGIARHTSELSFREDLVQVVKNVRERVIVEFPRPANTTAGFHHIDIVLPKSRAVIYPAGVGNVPIADPKDPDDPATLHREDSLPTPPPQ